MKRIIALAIVMLSGCATTAIERRLNALEEENRFLRKQNARLTRPAAAANGPGQVQATPQAPQATAQTVVQQGVVSSTVAPEPAGYHCFLYTKPTYGTFFFKIVNGHPLLAIVPEIDGRRVIVERPAPTISGYGAQPIGPQAVTVLYPGEYCYVPVDYASDADGTKRWYTFTASAYAKSHVSDGFVTVINARPVSRSKPFMLPLATSSSVTQHTFERYEF